MCCDCSMPSTTATQCALCYSILILSNFDIAMAIAVSSLLIN